MQMTEQYFETWLGHYLIYANWKFMITVMSLLSRYLCTKVADIKLQEWISYIHKGMGYTVHEVLTILVHCINCMLQDQNIIMYSEFVKKDTRKSWKPHDEIVTTKYSLPSFIQLL
jgi:hypothetical protein